jgi:hypothetical protein
MSFRVPLVLAIAVFIVSGCGGYEGRSVSASVTHMTMEPDRYDGARVITQGYLYAHPSGGLGVALTAQHATFPGRASSIKIYDAAAKSAILENPYCLDVWASIIGKFRVEEEVGFGLFELEYVVVQPETEAVICYAAENAT